MRHYYWLSSDRSELSDPLPTGLASPDYQPFNSTLVPVNAILKELTLDIHTLPLQSTYRDLAYFFQTYPAATGVLITTDQPYLPNQIVGMVSRQRFGQWRSQHYQWQQAQDCALPAVLSWWQEATSYMLIDHQMPLKDVIVLILDRASEYVHEPLVVQMPEAVGISDTSQLLATYTRLARSEQTMLADPDVESLRRQHQLILNAIGEGVYGVDVQGNATFVNPAAAQMIGWDAEDLIGKSMHKVLHHSRPNRTPYPREECPIYAAFQDGIIHRVSEEVFWRKDGTCFPVEYISTPMRDEQGGLIGAVIAFRDITQRKWAEAVLHRTNEELEQMVRERTAELQQANEQLKELSELRSRVVSMVCHEFRNPLNNILLSVSSIGRYDHQLTFDQKEQYLLSIRENVERMTQMIDAILIIGKVEAKRIEVQPSSFDLIPFCRGLIAELLPDSGDRVKFTSRAKEIQVTLDEQLLRSILTNILSNSIRYSPNLCPIQFKLLKRKPYVVFQVKDQGIGIPAADLPYLFEPFHRGRNVSNISGTGLGLNIVKRFVDLQQGKVEVESQLGVGTTFTVTLPQKYVHHSEMP
ncbi:MAG: hypothetical protein Kow00121_44740 [Elainellaceae cyanobacterium]